LDFKWLEGFGFRIGEFVLDDGVDAAAARAFVQLGAEVGEGFGVTGGDEFHFPAVGVADPAVQGELGGLALDEPAEADALHSAADEEVEDHISSVLLQKQILRSAQDDNE
jgi:hypothetical protein